MQSIFGALLTAGYASAVATSIADAPDASTEALAHQYPQYADAITAGAKSAFLDGDDWAYTAGVVAILIGAALVGFLFPRKDEEHRLLASYDAQDSAGGEQATHMPG